MDLHTQAGTHASTRVCTHARMHARRQAGTQARTHRARIHGVKRGIASLPEWSLPPPNSVILGIGIHELFEQLNAFLGVPLHAAGRKLLFVHQSDDNETKHHTFLLLFLRDG